jgi:hypothetical protein
VPFSHFVDSAKPIPPAASRLADVCETAFHHFATTTLQSFAVIARRSLHEFVPDQQLQHEHMHLVKHFQRQPAADETGMVGRLFVRLIG